MDIQRLAKHATESATYYLEPFNWLIDMHIPYLVDHPETRSMSLDPALVTIYRGDFYGLLTNLNIESRYHRPILLVNGMSSPREFSTNAVEILVPKKEVIDKLVAPYKNTGVLSV